MTAHEHTSPASLALFTLAEIKAATEGFDRGETNLFDTLDAIVMAVEVFRAAVNGGGRREAA